MSKKKKYKCMTCNWKYTIEDMITCPACGKVCICKQCIRDSINACICNQCQKVIQVKCDICTTLGCHINYIINDDFNVCKDCAFDFLKNEGPMKSHKNLSKKKYNLSWHEASLFVFTSKYRIKGKRTKDQPWTIQLDIVNDILIYINPVDGYSCGSVNINKALLNDKYKLVSINKGERTNEDS